MTLMVRLHPYYDMHSRALDSHYSFILGAEIRERLQMNAAMTDAERARHLARFEAEYEPPDGPMLQPYVENDDDENDDENDPLENND